MNKQNNSYLPVIVYGAIFLIFYLITYTDLFVINIGNAAPQLLVSAVVSVGIFYGEWTGFTVGMVTGIFADAVAANTVCFNMITFMLIGFITGLLINRLLNLNIFSAMILSLAASAFYHIAYWFIFLVIGGVESSGQYLLLHVVPSVIYSALFIFITYLPGRYLK